MDASEGHRFPERVDVLRLQVGRQVTADFRGIIGGESPVLDVLEDRCQRLPGVQPAVDQNFAGKCLQVKRTQTTAADPVPRLEQPDGRDDPGAGVRHPAGVPLRAGRQPAADTVRHDIARTRVVESGHEVDVRRAVVDDAHRLATTTDHLDAVAADRVADAEQQIA